MPRHELILALRVSLMDVEPEVWRRFLVPNDVTLKQFHEVLQGVMGWHDQHLFEFHTGQGRFGTRHDAFQDAGNPVRPGRSALLKNAISPQTRHLHYIYDMGDYWEHQIVLEEVLSNDTREPILQCVGGANQCPPEDIGGAGGYKIFLEAITDPSHEEHEYYVDVYGEGFDPGHFDLNEVNKRLCRTKRKLLRLQARAHDQSDIR